MPYTLYCAIIGRNDLFPAVINETRTVGELKDEIKTKKARTLASIEADNLVLYNVDIDISSDEAHEHAM